MSKGVIFGCYKVLLFPFDTQTQLDLIPDNQISEMRSKLLVISVNMVCLVNLLISSELGQQNTIFLLPLDS